MRILGTLFVLLLVFATLGWFRGWFVVESAAATRAHPRVVVDTEKVADDASAAAKKIGDKVGELSSRAAQAIEGKTSPATDGLLTVDGSVTAVDAALRQLDVRVGGDEMSLRVPESTPITVDGMARTFADLRVGQHAHLALRADGSLLLLQRVDVR